MNDLLNEDEFLQQEYHPKKWFIKSYSIFAVTLAATFALLWDADFENDLYALITLIVFIFVTPILFATGSIVFEKKVRLYTGYKTIFRIISTFLLIHTAFLIGYIARIMVGIYYYFPLNFYKTAVILAIVFGVNYLVSFLIVLIVTKRSRKIKNQ